MWAWAVSHLMNSTGNYKKAITPDKLLGKDKASEDKKGNMQKVDPQEKAKKLADLKAKFNS